MPAFDRPALVVWAAGDLVMPPENGCRLATLFPNARLLEIPDSYTLIPLDQPAQLAEAIRKFTSSTTIRRRLFSVTVNRRSARGSSRSVPYHQGLPVCGSTSVPR